MEQANITLSECHQMFQSRGVKISHASLSEFIIKGKMPFATAILRKETVYLIFKHAATEYLDQMCGKDKQ